MSTTPPDRTCKAYGEALAEIVDRIKAADELLILGSSQRVVEIAALDLRHALEGLALSSLVSHKEHLGEITKALKKADAGEARKRVEGVNSGWWPKPQDYSEGGPDEVVTLTGHHDPDFMTADEWGRSFGLVSDPLHARNPFVHASDPKEIHARLVSLVQRLLRLLRFHTISVPGETRLLFAQVSYEDVRVVWLVRPPGYDPAGVHGV